MCETFQSGLAVAYRQTTHRVVDVYVNELKKEALEGLVAVKTTITIHKISPCFEKVYVV